jgi:M6 family metalloprotease-like protein
MSGVLAEQHALDKGKHAMSPAGARAPKAVRTMRQAIIRVDFLRDGAGTQTTGDGRFDVRRNVTGVPVDPPPHDKTFLEAHAEALHRFYDVESYGTLDVQSTVFPADPDSAYHLDDTANYGPWEVSQNPDVAALAEKFVTDALKAADRSGDIDFGSFDAFAIVHAGADFQGDVNVDSPYDIPSFALTLSESLAVQGGTVKVGRALVLPETGSQDGRVAALNGVFAHEFGHILGLPDLYNIFNGVPQLGWWSLMDSGENLTVQVEDPTSGDVFYADGVFPTSLDPWSRWQIFPDAVKPVAVEESWHDTLEAVEASPVMPVSFIDGLEYFLVENRALDLDGNGFPYVQQDSTTGVFLGPVDDPDRPGTGGHMEYDAVLPGGGMLIWHIDDRYAVPGFISGAVNFQTGERGIALEEADGIWDMGRFNYGTQYDPFYVGNNAKFAPDTTPNSSANDGAYSGITIETTSHPGRFMDVSITRALAVTRWPVFLRDDTQVHTEPGPITTVDMSRNGVPEVVFGADAVKLNEPGRLRAIIDLSIDLSDTSLIADSLQSRLRPALAASNAFLSTTSQSPEAVVAGTLGNGRVYVWNSNGTDVLNGLGAVGAVTPPVIWQPASGSGAVLAAGIGTFHVITASGEGAHTDSAATAVNEAPTAGPTVIDALNAAAVGYQNGAIELFPVTLPGTHFSPLRMGGPVKYLLSGWVNPLRTAPSLVAVTDDSVAVFSPEVGARSAAWGLPHAVALEPELADLDGDGQSELAFVDTTGDVVVMNGDGSPALGWPKRVQKPARDLKLLDLNADGKIDVLVLDANGRFYGWNGRGTLLPTFPRALGIFNPISSVVETFVRQAEDPPSQTTPWIWVGIGEDLATGLPSLAALRVGTGFPSPSGDWRYPGQTRERGSQQLQPAGGTVTGEPVLDHPLLAYPNPAKEWVELRFLLDTGESADLEVLDLSGKVIDDARLDRRGGFRTGENAVRWDLTDMAPGLYFCRLERSGSSAGSKVDIARVVVLR